MKKRYLVIMIAQTVIILLMFVYVFIQKLEADKNLMEAQRQEKIATEARQECEKLRVEVETFRQQKGQ